MKKPSITQLLLLDTIPDDEKAFSIKEMNTLIKAQEAMVVKRLCSSSSTYVYKNSHNKESQ